MWLELRTVRKENASLAVAMKKYWVQVKNLKNEVDKKDSNGTTLLQELKRSKKETEQKESEKRLERQTTKAR